MLQRRKHSREAQSEVLMVGRNGEKVKGSKGTKKIVKEMNKRNLF